MSDSQPKPREPSMASRAREELELELTELWREEIGRGKDPRKDSRVSGFAKFAVFLRQRMWQAAPEITDKESNLLLGRLLVRFPEYIKIREHVEAAFMAQKSLKRLLDIANEPPVIPPRPTSGVIQGSEEPTNGWWLR